MLPICSCAAVSGTRTIEEIAEWGRRAAVGLPARMGVRRHLSGRYRAPFHPALTRILAAVDGDALDTAVGACLAEHDRGDVQAAAAPERAIAVDGKALAGSAHLVQRHRHLLSAVSHAPATITLAQREVGAKTNETAVFRPLLESLDPAEAVITFDAMHSVKDQVRWLVQDERPLPRGHQGQPADRVRAVVQPAVGRGAHRPHPLAVRTRPTGIPLAQDAHPRRVHGRAGLPPRSADAAGAPPPPGDRAQTVTRDRLRRHQPGCPPRPPRLTWPDTFADTRHWKTPATM